MYTLQAPGQGKQETGDDAGDELLPHGGAP